jgi:ABC-type transporter Mla subunit MlaD
MRTGGSSGLMGSPILMGAITCLVTVIAVFLAYNANSGLPFVPTYDVSVQVPDAAGLVAGNDVRVGGKRVGTITKIAALETPAGPVARLDLKLDKTAEPLHTSARVTVRPRSPLGLKYLEVIPVKRGPALAAGETLPLRQARQVVDLDQVLNAFDQGSRRSLQLMVAGLGGGLAGRGADLNSTFAATPPLMRGVERVSANLADLRTGLDGALRGLDRTMEEVAAAGPALGSIVRASDTTAGALASVAPQLQDVISAQLHDAVRAGIPVVRRALGLSERLRTALGAVDVLASDPLTSGALDRLLLTLRSALPTVRFLAPFQTTCNYLGLWTRNVDSTISEGDDSGTWFRTIVIGQPDEASARADPSPNLHVNPYGNTAAPGQTHECEPGNEPYLPGQRIGNVPGNQGTRTETTSPPAGVGGP